MFASLLKVAASAALALPLAFAAEAGSWTVNHDTSRLGFEVQQGPALTAGEFGSWTAKIDFDPATPETAEITATIETGSATTGNGSIDQVLPTPDWFNVGEFPAAEFTSETVTLIEGNAYRAEGNLTIRGASHPVTLDFTLVIDGGQATITGSAEVLRLDYGLGATTGEEQVSNAVRVVISLKATR